MVCSTIDNGKNQKPECMKDKATVDDNVKARRAMPRKAFMVSETENSLLRRKSNDETESVNKPLDKNY